MKARSVVHSTFAIERVYPAAPARVFRAWADPAAKRAWSYCHEEWKPALYELDFRVGGWERLHFGPPDGPMHRNETLYQDIVPDQRIVFTYDMCVGDERISVSLVTVQLTPEGTGTRLTFTEQGAFLDGLADPAEREEGTRVGLGNLVKVLP
jgi:uncharacterized protein YndB with AHSA1/START domain